MSNESKQAAWSVAKVGCAVAVLGFLMSITRAVWTVASTWGEFSSQVRSIDARLTQHIEQTERFRRDIEERLRRIEGKVGKLEGDFQ
jgi:uncharacterized protein YoxC